MPIQSAPPVLLIDVYSHTPLVLCRVYVPLSVPASITTERSGPTDMSNTPVSYEGSTCSVDQDEALPHPEEQWERDSPPLPLR